VEDLPKFSQSSINDILTSIPFLLYLCLKEVCIVSFKNKIEDFEICKLKSNILLLFSYLKILEPEYKIFPKLHHLTHYPEMIRKFGPLVSYSSLPFERKHQFFKEWARIMHNSINPAYSLAERHQCEQALNIKEKSYEQISSDCNSNPDLLDNLPPSAIYLSKTSCKLNKGKNLLIN
jgi:hypothetical protein